MTLKIRNRPFPKTVVPAAGRRHAVPVRTIDDNGNTHESVYWLSDKQMAAYEAYKLRRDYAGARRYVLNNGKRGE